MSTRDGAADELAETEDELTETEVAIMRATYAALREHGYANLTMGAIAEEFGKTQAAIHYHYGTKEELILAFLEYLLDRFAASIEVDAGAAPDDRLVSLVDVLLFGSNPADTGEEYWDFRTALMELSMQAPHDEAIRAQLTASYRFIRETLASTIAEGIEAGVFREVDPDRAAIGLLAAINGARLMRVVLGIDDVATEVRATIVEGAIEGLKTTDAS